MTEEVGQYCSICWGKNSKKMRLLKCRECSVLYHNECYRGVSTDAEELKELDLAPLSLCDACKSIGKTVKGRTADGTHYSLKVEDRPYECCLCSVGEPDLALAMQPVYDRNHGRQLVLEGGGGVGAPRHRLAWCHTLCARFINAYSQTGGCVYSCDREGYYGGHEADDTDRSIGSDIEDAREDEREKLNADEYGVHHQVITISKKLYPEYVKLIKKAQEFQCQECFSNDKPANIYRIAIPCMVNEEGETDYFAKCHGDDADECEIARHVGCAVWGRFRNGQRQLPPLRRIYFLPFETLPDSVREKQKFPKDVSMIYCNDHAGNLLRNNVKGANQARFPGCKPGATVPADQKIRKEIRGKVINASDAIESESEDEDVEEESNEDEEDDELEADSDRDTDDDEEESDSDDDTDDEVENDNELDNKVGNNSNNDNNNSKDRYRRARKSSENGHSGDLTRAKKKKRKKKKKKRSKKREPKKDESVRDRLERAMAKKSRTAAVAMAIGGPSKMKNNKKLPARSSKESESREEQASLPEEEPKPDPMSAPIPRKKSNMKSSVSLGALLKGKSFSSAMSSNSGKNSNVINKTSKPATSNTHNENPTSKTTRKPPPYSLKPSARAGFPTAAAPARPSSKNKGPKSVAASSNGVAEGGTNDDNDASCSGSDDLFEDGEIDQSNQAVGEPEENRQGEETASHEDSDDDLFGGGSDGANKSPPANDSDDLFGGDADEGEDIPTANNGDDVSCGSTGLQDIEEDPSADSERKRSLSDVADAKENELPAKNAKHSAALHQENPAGNILFAQIMSDIAKKRQSSVQTDELPKILDEVESHWRDQLAHCGIEDVDSFFCRIRQEANKPTP